MKVLNAAWPAASEDFVVKEPDRFLKFSLDQKIAFIKGMNKKGTIVGDGTIVDKEKQIAFIKDVILTRLQNGWDLNSNNWKESFKPVAHDYCGLLLAFPPKILLEALTGAAKGQADKNGVLRAKLSEKAERALCMVYEARDNFRIHNVCDYLWDNLHIAFEPASDWMHVEIVDRDNAKAMLVSFDPLVEYVPDSWLAH